MRCSKKTCTKKKVSVSSTQHVKLDLPVSCFVDGVLPPMLKNSVKNEVVIATASSQKYLQRVVATQKSYHSTHGRLDSVMAENGEIEDVSALTTLQFSAWFAKYLLFLKILRREKKKRTDTSDYNNAETACQRNESCYEKLYFVH